MQAVNEYPILGKKMEGEIVFESGGGEKYTFLHLEEGGAAVVPNYIIYTKSDGRYGINYQVFQEAGIRLGEGDTVQKAISELEARKTLEDKTLYQKFSELGIHVDDVYQTKHGENIVTDRGKKVSVRNVSGSPVKPYQAHADTNMVIVNNNGDYYFLPKACEGSGKKRPGQFYLSERLIKNIGPNRFDLLEYLVSNEKEKEINDMYLEKVKTGRGRVPSKTRQEQRKKMEPMAEAISQQVSSKVLDSAESFMEEVMTNPDIRIKEITTNIDNDLDATFKNGGIGLQKGGSKIELSTDEMKKLLKTMEAMKTFYAH
jgi:hypothetical protein